MTNKRTPGGQALVEAVVALAMIVATLIGGTYLLLNVGAAMYGQEQIGLLSTGAALVASINDDGTTPPVAAKNAAQNYVSNAATIMKIQGASVQSIQKITIGGVNGTPSFQITVSGRTPLMFNAFGTTLPVQSTSVMPIAAGQASLKYSALFEIPALGGAGTNYQMPAFPTGQNPHTNQYPNGAAIPTWSLQPQPGTGCGCGGQSIVPWLPVPVTNPPP